ncbi:hypothetical protein H6F90_29730 [Trichocoleus sp. FACHB-591]|uniref:hypothetical protein n=1 Tax=Trichocoleus sp. FACHB-591 TaxID=2692872 RepID=UPI00168705E2|nr:hypothetical protein [Trichocoleus sp. FACHB-591]MBD2099247.1 hypothetical protein [Trichocoleus sp. FACHB-591]
MEIILFTYRSWVIEVTPEQDGWTARVRHPKSENFCVAAQRLLLASDAVTAAMGYVNQGVVAALIKPTLLEWRRSNRLQGEEFANLMMSPNRYWRSQLPGKKERS